MFDLAVSGREAEIRELFDFFLARGIDVRSFLVGQADLFARIGPYPEYLEGCVRIGRLVAGNDAATTEMVKNYSKPAKPPSESPR